MSTGNKRWRKTITRAGQEDDSEKVKPKGFLKEAKRLQRARETTKKTGTRKELKGTMVAGVHRRR